MSTAVTIIGHGTMGKAIAQALRADKTIDISTIERDSKIGNSSPADFIILAVKPKDINDAAEKVKSLSNAQTIIISILAGTSIKTLSKLLGTPKIVRAMPNLGLSVGAGIAVFKMNDGFTLLEQVSAKKLLDRICENVEVKTEKLIDAATAISGSGPAYFFALAEAMMQGAQALGLDPKTSRLLVSKTLYAASSLQEEQGYKDLIQEIASKGGTTEAALKIFKQTKFDTIVLQAVKAASKRAVEISKATK